MVEEAAHGDGLLVGAFEIGQIGGYALGEADLALVVELHDGQQGGGGLGHGGKVVDIAWAYTLHGLTGDTGILIGVGAKHFVVDGVALLHDDYLTAWEGVLTDA